MVFHSLSQRHRNLVLLVYINSRMLSSTQQRSSYLMCSAGLTLQSYWRATEGQPWPLFAVCLSAHISTLKKKKKKGKGSECDDDDINMRWFLFHYSKGLLIYQSLNFITKWLKEKKKRLKEKILLVILFIQTQDTLSFTRLKTHPYLQGGPVQSETKTSLLTPTRRLNQDAKRLWHFIWCQLNRHYPKN